jgi:hypothetical protein
MPTTIIIPSQFKIDALSSFTTNIVGLDGFPYDTDFIFDFERIQFIDGTGLTVLCNTLEWLRSHNVKCHFINHSSNKAALSYLDDCQFFERQIGKKLNATSSVRQTTLPFQRVEHARAHGWLETQFTPWMANQIACSPLKLGSLRTCIKELFNNIHDHSTQQNGFIHVQFYPKNGKIQISVSDFGKGIPSNIKPKFGSMMNDGLAISKATEEGVTSQSIPQNRGVGLKFLVDHVTGNHGFLSIYSYQGILHCGIENGQVMRYPSLNSAIYPGTLVNIWLHANKFIGDDIEEKEDLRW